MKLDFRSTWKEITSDESGSSEVITTLFMVPILLWLIFSLIDVSLYFQARTSVQNVARDAARQSSIWGGNQSSLRPFDESVSQNARNALFDEETDTCIPGACSEVPTVNCTPNVTSYAGDTVSCTISYTYRPVYSGNPFTGFGSLLNSPIVITETSRAETGFSS